MRNEWEYRALLELLRHPQHTSVQRVAAATWTALLRTLRYLTHGLRIFLARQERTIQVCTRFYKLITLLHNRFDPFTSHLVTTTPDLIGRNNLSGCQVKTYHIIAFPANIDHKQSDSNYTFPVLLTIPLPSPTLCHIYFFACHFKSSLAILTFI